jgi:hypothetical protein
MSYHRFYEWFETFYLDGNENETGWYWWLSKPGFLPEGPEHGPFLTRDEAVDDAKKQIPERE